MAIQSAKVTINGVDCILTYNTGSGKWEGTMAAPNYTSYNANADHTYHATVSATNSANTTTTKDYTDGTLGASLKLVVKELTPPTVTIVSPSSGARVNTGTPTITFQLRDEANGSGIKIDSLQLKVDGGATITNVSSGMTCTPVTNGYDCTYVIPGGSAIADGSHTVTISIQDNDLNTSTVASTNFTVDTVPPALNITSPTNNFITNNSVLTVSGSTSDTTSNPVVVTIKLGGVDQGAITLTAGSFSKDITLVPGVNTIIITATDASGLHTDITRTVTLDTSAPIISAVSITPNPANAGQTLIISVTVSG